jgi:hypothetical protein
MVTTPLNVKSEICPNNLATHRVESLMHFVSLTIIIPFTSCISNQTTLFENVYGNLTLRATLLSPPLFSRKLFQPYHVASSAKFIMSHIVSSSYIRFSPRSITSPTKSFRHNSASLSRSKAIPALVTPPASFSPKNGIKISKLATFASLGVNGATNSGPIRPSQCNLLCHLALQLVM